jgi:hypothetical protein
MYRKENIKIDNKPQKPKPMNLSKLSHELRIDFTIEVGKICSLQFLMEKV